VEFQALPSRTGQVRRIVSAQLRYWKLDALVAPAADGVAELLAGVHRHVGPDGRCTVEIALRLDRLTISVRDQVPRLSPVQLMGVPLGGGLGPARRDGAGETAWITLPVPAPAAPADGAPDTAAGPVDAGTAGGSPHRRPLPAPDPLPGPEPLPRA
jgi:hypothetical protein